MNYVALITVIIMIILNSVGLVNTVKAKDRTSIAIESVMLAITLIFAFLCFFKKNCAALGWFFLIMGILRVIFSIIILLAVENPGFSRMTKYDPLIVLESKRILEIVAVVNMVVASFMIYLGSRKSLA